MHLSAHADTVQDTTNAVQHHNNMRLWTIHPRYLDGLGLVALWREGLLAQQVLRGRTRGYRHHPQVVRFRAHAHSLGCIASYLSAVHGESLVRGYRFDATKIGRSRAMVGLAETEGQLLYEWSHLMGKLRKRAPRLYRELQKVGVPDPHPLFRIVPGGVRSWEGVRAEARSNNRMQVPSGGSGVDA